MPSNLTPWEAEDGWPDPRPRALADRTLYDNFERSGCARLSLTKTHVPKWESINTPFEIGAPLGGSVLIQNVVVASLQPWIAPFVTGPLSGDQLGSLDRYLDLLLKWNAKMSLTAIRDPQEIARRHFGESLFAGEQLNPVDGATLADLGSGAGFPGLPIATLFPRVEVTLIESQQKKVAFLREVIRSLALKNARVHAGRAEGSGLQADIVTLRAVENFGSILPVAASLLARHGRLTLLIGSAQTQIARNNLPEIKWNDPIPIPQSRQRVVFIGTPQREAQ